MTLHSTTQLYLASALDWIDAMLRDPHNNNAAGFVSSARLHLDGCAQENTKGRDMDTVKAGEWVHCEPTGTNAVTAMAYQRPMTDDELFERTVKLYERVQRERPDLLLPGDLPERLAAAEALLAECNKALLQLGDRGVTLDASWFFECLHNLPATGTPLFIGQAIGHGIADALQERMPHIFGAKPDATAQEAQHGK